MSSQSSPSLFHRVRAFYRLVDRLIDANHDVAALEQARTILDRSERTFAADPALDRRAGMFCGFPEVESILQLQKTIEDWEGAALNGGAPQAGAVRSDRSGNDGMAARRQALAQVMRVQAHRQQWGPIFRSFFVAPDSQWRWRPSRWWQHFMLEDGAALLFQPLVILVAPSKGLLLRAATTLEELCPPPPYSPPVTPIEAALPRMAYAGAVLLDLTGNNPPEIEEQVRRVIDLRRSLSEQGWPIASVELVVVGGDPVSVALAEWAEQERNVADFSTAWEDAVSGVSGAILAPVLAASTETSSVQALVARLTGQAVDWMSAPALQQVRSVQSGVVRCTLTRVENLHHVASQLLERAGIEDVDAQVMTRARLMDSRRIFAVDSCLQPASSLSPVGLAYACEKSLPKSLFTAEETAAIIGKWSARGAAEEGEVFVFPHIPKTAGSSVHYHLKTNLEYDRAYVHIPIDYSTRQELRERTPFPLRDRRERALARVMFGHGIIRRHASLVPGKVAREITTLRDPVDRTISHYNFWMNVLEKRGEKAVPFDVWYAGEPRNYHLHWLGRNYLELDAAAMGANELFARVSEMLEGFWLVCTIPTFEADIQHLLDALSLPPMNARQNVGGVTHAVRFEADADLRARLEAENALDVQLYRHWLQRAQARHAGVSATGEISK